jgi:Tfp pilus assembly protein PilF
MNDIDDIKFELIARFADLSEDLVIDNRHLWDYNALVRNPNIIWNIDLLRKLKDEFDWSLAYVLTELKSEPSFIQEFEELIDYSNILLLEPKSPWPLDFLSKNEQKFPVYLLIRNAPSGKYATSLLRKYSSKLTEYEWEQLCRTQEFEFSEDLISEFIDEIDWRGLSSNSHFNRHFDLLFKFQDFVSWDNVSSSIKDIGVIIGNYEFEKWNWDRVTINQNFIPFILANPELSKIVWEKVPQNKWLPGDGKSLSKIFKSYMRFIDSSGKHSKEYFFRMVFLNQAINAQDIYDLIKSSGKSQDLIDSLTSNGVFRNVKLESDDFGKWFKNLKHDDSTFVRLNRENYNDELIEEHIEFVKDTLSEINSVKMSISIPLSKKMIKKYNLEVNISKQLSFSNYTWEWEEIEDLIEKRSVSYLGSKKILFDQLIENMDIVSFLRSLYSGKEDNEAVSNENEPLDDKTKLASKFYYEAILKGNENDFVGAKELCTKAIEVAPKYYLAHNDRGLCNHFLGNYEEALSDFNVALNLKKDDYFFFCRGNTFLAMKEFDLAIEDYNNAIDLKSDDNLYFLNRGNAYAKSGHHDLAIEDYTKSINLNRHPGTFRNRALSYRELGDEENAKKDMQWAILYSSVKG